MGHILKLSRDEYKKLKIFEITYGIADTQFGKCLLGLHSDRICFLKFRNDPSSCLEDLTKVFPRAQLIEDGELIKAISKEIFDGDFDESKIVLKGTEFEILVWEELLNIKKGTTWSYEDVAKALGKPKAVRAVANAIAKNNVSYLVPCHRVISKDGSLNKYGGGVETKLHLLRYEKAM